MLIQMKEVVNLTLINVIILAVVCLIAVAGFVVVAFLVAQPFLKSIASTRAMEAQNEKYKLFTNISPEAMHASINDYVDKTVSQYIVYKFMSKKQTYIRENEVENIVLDITKLISLDISELYIFYIKMISDVHDDEGLLRYIRGKVRNSVVESVSSYNSAAIPAEERK